MGIQPNFWKIYVSRSKDLTSNSIKNKIDLLKSELETIITWGLWLRREIFFYCDEIPATQLVSCVIVIEW